MSSQAVNVNVNNVYDFAYEIALEFEKLVILYGFEKIRPVVDKVIHVLETLECCILKNEQLETELNELKSSSLHLSSEKLVSDQEKSKLKQIYEESEESWLAEVAVLKSQLSLLKSENESLRNRSMATESSMQSDNILSVIQEQENVICNLKQIIKQKDKQLQDKSCNINNLNVRIQELLKLNRSLHKKNQEAKNDISKLLLEKNEYRSELMQAKRENFLLHESIEELIESGLHSQSDRRCSDGELSEELLDDNICGRNDVKILEKIKILQCELQHVKFKFQGSKDISSANTIENNSSFSKIQQFFQLFLGVTAIPEFWT